MPRTDLQRKKEYDHNYHLQHKDEISRRHKKWLQDNKQRNPKSTKLWRESHRDSLKEYSKKYRQEHGGKELNRKQWLMYAYGLTPSDYEIMLENQNGACAICRKTSDKPLHVDHIHVEDYSEMLPEEKRKLVRGLLCDKCNTALGFAFDDVTILQNMISYLNYFSGKEMFE